MNSRNKIHTGWCLALSVATLLLATQPLTLGQDASGKIVGTITDQQGAVIAGARITITSTGTQSIRETVTDKDGSFQVLSLPLGSYRLTGEHPGFKRAVTEVISLQINQALRVDMSLEVGGNTEQVEVTVQSSTVETISPTIGQSVTGAQIQNLPLNGRNVLDLASLQTGVSESNPGDGGAGTLNIGGGRADSVTFLLDGGNNNNLLSNGVVYNPNPDTVAEFRLLKSNYTAEYGRNGGGVISVVTKSGTNSYHGSIYDYLRNDAFNANSFFNNRDGVPREVLKRNQYGFTIGGPLTLPHFGEGGVPLKTFKDRAFFFLGYQGQRQTTTETSSSVPTFTPAELTGDFSRSNEARTGPDLLVVSFLQANPFFQPNPAKAAQGIIDPTRINSVAKNYITAGLIPTAPTGLLTSQAGAKNDADELTMKFDFVLRTQDRVMVTLGSSRNPQFENYRNSNVNGYPDTNAFNRYFANIAYTTVLSPALLNELRFTTQRLNQKQRIPASKQPTAAQLGIGTTPDNPTGPPILGFGKGLTIGFSPNGPTTLINNTFSYSDTVSWTKGNHNLKFGATFSPYQNNTVYDFYVNGEFFFYGNSGGEPLGIGSGNDFADFLTGAADEYLQFGEAPSDIRTKSTYGFGQDEWRVRPNLTLTFGLRYEYDTPKIDTRGRSFTLKYGAHSTVFPNAPTGLLFPGDPGAPKGANFDDKNNFAPRFGFAWAPGKGSRTSIRGGFGVFYDILKGEDNLQFNGQAPFFGYSDLFFDPPASGLTKELNYLTQPYVATGVPNSFPSKPPAKNIDFDASGFLPFGGGGVFFVDPHLRTPYIYQYNLSVQRELAGNLIAEVNYVGSSSHKLTSLVDVNPFILGQNTRVFNAQPGAFFSYLLQFNNAINATYNSLQANLTKNVSRVRYLGNTYFNLGYTWAHAIDTASGFRNRNSQVPSYNAQQFRASSDFDVRHRVVFSGGWDLPFDQMWQRGPKALTTGWRLSPIATWRTGFPLDIFAGLSSSRSQAGPSGTGDRQLVRANLVGSSITLYDPKQAQTLSSNNGNFYFNPANFNSSLPTSAQAIANAAIRTYGSLPRNYFRGPGRTNFDLSIAKITPLYGENVKAEFRAEFFNILNHTEFTNPDTSISSNTFGQITTSYAPRIIQLALRITF